VETRIRVTFARNLANLQGERSIFELLLHLAWAEITEVAALARRGAVRVDRAATWRRSLSGTDRARIHKHFPTGCQRGAFLARQQYGTKMKSRELRKLRKFSLWVGVGHDGGAVRHQNRTGLVLGARRDFGAGLVLPRGRAARTLKISPQSGHESGRIFVCFSAMPTSGGYPQDWLISRDYVQKRGSVAMCPSHGYTV